MEIANAVETGSEAYNVHLVDYPLLHARIHSSEEIRPPYFRRLGIYREKKDKTTAVITHSRRLKLWKMATRCTNGLRLSVRDRSPYLESWQGALTATVAEHPIKIQRVQIAGHSLPLLSAVRRTRPKKLRNGFLRPISSNH